METGKQRKKELAAAYTQTIRPVGVYQIRNTSNGKVWVDGTMDLGGASNRFDFMKQTNMNTIFELREDWKTFGSSCFVFEELDRLKPKEEAAGDPGERARLQGELDVLLALWLDKLQPYDDKGYNKRKRQ
ncbi:MAG: GIY-YIG nuclease family protein [Paenibacillaceae bacterium]|nr:GIY-YIG nuclease family protein [Paenibacillaceae bacterium]